MIAALLGIAAFALATTFIEYRVQPIRRCPGSFDVICMAPDQFVSLGMTQIEPKPDSDVARFRGKILGDRGLYSRFALPLPFAIVLGVLVPLLALIAAFVLILRRPSNIDSRVTA
jgi:hypothetical protein